MSTLQFFPVRVFVAAMALVATSAGALAQQTADLRTRLTPGQTDRFEFFQEGRLTLTMPQVPGTGGEQTVTQEMRVALKIDEANDDGATGTITFERFALTLSGGGMEAAFDSDDPESKDADNPIALMLRPLIGKSIGVVFDAEGNVTALTGVKDVLPAGALGGGLAGLLGEEGLKGGVTLITSSGSSGGVRRVGESWTSTDKIDVPEGGGALEMTTTHHLQSVRGEKATVTIEADLAKKRGDKDADASGVDLRTSTLEGRYEWDTERGMLNWLQFDRVIEFEVDRGGATSRVKQDVRTKVKRVEE